MYAIQLEREPLQQKGFVMSRPTSDRSRLSDPSRPLAVSASPAGDRRSHIIAVLQAFLVTVLWSSSWVLIKWGLGDIPALTFAGLRYFLAFLCLVPFVAGPSVRREIAALRGKEWAALTVLGVVFYAVTQGAQFLALSFLPAQMTSLFLSFSPVVVVFASAAFLGERATAGQLGGVLIFLAGAALFLLPITLPAGSYIGLVVVTVGMLGTATGAVVGRAVNRNAHLSPVTVTVVSMGIGATLLLVTGTVVQGLPRITARSVAIIVWLSVVNTAFAFTLWNRTLKRLSALESSIINNTMLIQIAVLAWIFLGEDPGPRRALGLAVAAVGTLTVQLSGARDRSESRSRSTMSN